MKRLLAGLFLSALLAGSAWAQPQTLFQNFGTLNFGISGLPSAPSIDAVTVENFGNINASHGSVLWDTQNTLNFINRPSGVMNGAPGFRFDHLPSPDSGNRLPLTGFTNTGNIFATEHIQVNANQIVVNNQGLLSVDAIGRVLIQATNSSGTNVNLFNGRVRAGSSSTRPQIDGFKFTRNNVPFYIDPGNIVDEFWGATNGTLLSLPALAFGGQSGSSVPGRFRNGAAGSIFININDFFNPPGYQFFIKTNPLFLASAANANPRLWNTVVQMVFVQTNANSPGVRVFFPPSTNSQDFFVSDVVTEFFMTDTDPISGQPINQSLFLIDDHLTLAQPNASGFNSPNVLANNEERPSLFRPFGFELIRSGIPGTNFFFGAQAAEVTFTNLFIFTNGVNVATNLGARYETNRVPHQASTYSFTVTPRDLSNGGLGFGPALSEPQQDVTNAPGRIEIQADKLNLRFARLRAENLLNIKANALVESTGFQADAQNVNLELAQTNSPGVTISNSFPLQVRRMNGSVAVWSGIYQVDQLVTNTAAFPLEGFHSLPGSNTVRMIFQVVVVQNQLNTNQPVAFENFRVGAPLTLADPVTVNKSFFLGADSLFLPPTGSITLSGTNQNLTSANVPNLKFLTNQGSIFAPQLINLGFDRPPAQQFSNIVNSGFMQARTLLFRARHFLNTGFLFAFNGPIFIEADTNRLSTNNLFAATNVRLTGGEVLATGSTINAGGTLFLEVTNRLSDLGATNNWSVNGGFSLDPKPDKGDLLSTQLRTVAPANLNSLHFWGAEDRGDNPSGFLNNTALGRLVLDAQPGGTFFFTGTGPQNGLYIEFLEFRNSAINPDGTANTNALIVDPSLTIYFGNANVPPDKLTNAFGGRFVFVSPSTLAGPMMTVQLSMTQSTNITAQTYRALLPDEGDYDGDGIPNYLDPTPLSGFAVTDIRVVNLPPQTTLISWQGLANTTYYVEYKTSIASTTWLPLFNTFSPANGPVTVGDTSAGGSQRFYRVRYDRPPPQSD